MRIGARSIPGGVVLTCLAVLLVGAAASIDSAQSVTGTLLGTVRDASGAVLAGAKVTVVNHGTGLTRTLLNHPQFANPNTQIGNAAVGTISAMLSNPACALCGTTERQIQIGAKVTF